MNQEAMAAQMNAAAMWSSSLAAQDPRLTSPSERRVTSPADVKMLHNTSLSPRPPTVSDMSEKEREYHMSQQAASRHYVEHSPNRSVATSRDRRQLLESHDTSRDYHRQGDYHHHGGGARDAAMTHGDVLERRTESRGHELKTAASLQQMHSPNVHQASPHHARQVMFYIFTGLYFIKNCYLSVGCLLACLRQFNVLPVVQYHGVNFETRGNG